MFFFFFFFFFKQKTAYEMSIGDWSSDVCSSDLRTFQDIARTHSRLAVLAGATEIDYARAAGVPADQLEVVESQSELFRRVSDERVPAGALTRISLVDALRRNPG